MTDLAHQSV